MRVVTLRGRVSFWDHFVRGSVVIFFFQGCSEDVMYIFFSFFLRYIVFVHEILWPFIDIHCIFFLFYIVMYVFLLPTFFMCCFFSLFIYMLLIICMQSIISVLHKDALMSFIQSVSEIQVVKSLLSINSLIAKFFKSLCQDRFYCI